MIRRKYVRDIIFLVLNDNVNNVRKLDCDFYVVKE